MAGSRPTLRPDGLSAARTLTRPKGPVGDRAGERLAPGQILASPHSRLRYRARRLLGAGGFGQVYLARRLGRSSVVPATVCIKVSERSDAWVREAYFGQLLDGHPRAATSASCGTRATGGGRPSTPSTP
jgi:serine/threonine protein kinase